MSRERGPPRGVLRRYLRQVHGRPWNINFLRHLKCATPIGFPMFPYTIDRYRRIMTLAERRMGLELGLTPHSPRAGYATDARAAGRSVEEIKFEGRWLSGSSFRIYLDLVGAAEIGLQLKAKGLADACAWAVWHWPQYITPQSLYLTAIPRGPSVSRIRAAYGAEGVEAL